MPWGRIDDRLAMSVKIRGLTDPGVTGLRAKKQRAESLGVWSQLLSWASGERSDGFVTADILDLFGWDEANERLLRARFGRAPLLHRRADGEACECMTGRTWVDDYEYLIHDYLDRNPSRSENDVHRAKARELKDPKLKHAVRVRDRDTCRYCGKVCRHSDRKSDDGLTFDHVDPEIADGMNNLVVACRGCNNRKRRRTPEQAGMALLPAPTDSPAVTAVTESGSGPAPDLGPDPDRTTDPATEPNPDPDPDPPPGTPPVTSTDSTRVYAETNASTTDRTHDAGSPGRGRGGPGTAPGADPPAPHHGHRQPSATAIGPPTTPRGPLHGSPYLRQTRPIPEHQAGHPPQPDRPEHQNSQTRPPEQRTNDDDRR